MHARTIVTRVIGPCLQQLHRKQAAALARAVCAALMGGVISLSAIALSLNGVIRFKHRLKSVDRLLGSASLQAVRTELYAALAARWLGGLRTVVLVIDWSDLTRDQKWQWLRASVVVEGRSVTLYEEVHPQRRYAHPQVHRRFLARVAALLPTGCVPIVMTDAGFHAAWFKLVAARGWPFVGRIRGRDQVQLGDQLGWQRATALYARAGIAALDLGHVTYVRSNPIRVRLVLTRRPAKGRHRINMYGQPRIGRASAKCARSAREPWLLAASPALDHLQAQAIVGLYAQRMRIEQSFRDAKNRRWGLGLETARSRSAERLQMLLLIAHLAGFVQRLIGEHAKARQLELNFMATHRANRAEISVLTLARRMLQTPAVWLRGLTPWSAIPPLTEQAANACTL